MTTPESKVKAKLKQALKELPHPFYQFWPVQTGMGAPTLDMLGCYKGNFIAIETKARGKHPTPRQHMLIEQIEQAGGWAYVIDGDVSITAMLEDLKCL